MQNNMKGSTCYLFFTVLVIGGIKAIGGKGEEWQLGPFIKQDGVNPILRPLNSTTFFCPLRNEIVNWESKDVFNPTALVKDGEVLLLYRGEDQAGIFAGTSRIGLGVSRDGLSFTREPEPIFYPSNDTAAIYEWEGGCEDPRIVLHPSGTYFMTYTAYDGTTARLLVASTKDLRVWHKHGPVFKAAGYEDLWSKSGAIVTKLEGDSFIALEIEGKYWMYWGDTNMYMAWSDDLIDWTPLTDPLSGNLTVIFGPREGMFDSDLVEPGPQAFLWEEAILLIYNGRNAKEGGDPLLGEGTYSAGQILLNATRPWEVLKRCEEYFMTPEKDYEVVGQVNNVVFLEGLVHYNQSWLLYYGTADSNIAVARAG